MKYSLKHIVIVVVMSGIAAVGTLPYGFRFARLFFQTASFLQLGTGITFAASAALANMALGTYSLLSIESYKKIKQSVSISLICLLASLPNGFMCYFGYENMLPRQLNMGISFIVALVNAGIGFTAIKNLFNKITSISDKKNLLQQKGVGMMAVGILMGVVVSVIPYLAAANGVSNVLKYYAEESAWVAPLSYSLALLPWLPVMALYVNANQSSMKEAYQFLFQSTASKKSFYSTIALLVFSIVAASALAQMSIDFFSPTLDIPQFFKTPEVQKLVYPVIMPMTFLSATAINYFALKNVIKKFSAAH